MERYPPQLRPKLGLLGLKVKVFWTFSVETLSLTYANTESAHDRSQAVLAIEFEEYDLPWSDQSNRSWE